MDELGKSVIKKAKKCPDRTVESPAYKGLQEFTRRFFAVCPLVAAFKRPSFEKRHWRDLLYVCFPSDDPPDHPRSSFKVPEQDPEFLVGRFFGEPPEGLGLHRVVPAVEALVAKAEAEFAQQAALAALEARWRAVAFVREAPPAAAGAAAPGKKLSRKEKAKAARAAAAVAHLLPELALRPDDADTLRADQVRWRTVWCPFIFFVRICL